MTATMSEADKFFHLFPDLPTELHLAIWRECLSRRVVELDMPIRECALEAEFDDEDLPICNIEHTTKANSVPPLISRVCREARSVVFEKGWPFPDPGPWNKTTMLITSRAGQWFDPLRDIIHFNFGTAYDNPNFCCSTSRGNPLP